MILVTGANGLLGSYICKTLIENNFKVKALVREDSNTSLLNSINDQIELVHGDVLDPDGLEEYLSEVDTIIHCAAIVSFISSEKKKMMNINVVGTANMVNLALTHNISYFIHISSVAALGRLVGKELVDENNKWETSDLNSNYAYSKHLAEMEVWRGMEEGLEGVILNPSVVISGDDLNRSSGQIFKYVSDENKFYPEGLINYVDVRDVCRVLVRCLYEKVNKERFILNGGAVTFKELFNEIAAQLNKKAPTIKTTGFLNWVGLFIDAIKSLITGSKRNITIETIRLSNSHIYFNNEKVMKRFNIEFISLNESIKWACNNILQNH